jgi:hypothetical protein
MSSLTATFDDANGRVTLAVASVPSGTVTVHLERSADQVTYVDVRGAQAVAAASAASFRDYEYGAAVANFYRARYFKVDGTSAGAANTATVTPAQTGTWLKNPTRPFLNRLVTITDFDDLTRSSRSGVFDVIGRTLPVARTDLMSGRSTSITMRVDSPHDADDLEEVIAVGEVLFVQPPADADPPTLYAVPTGLSRKRVANTSSARLLVMPLTECAMPDLSVAAVQSTWQTVTNTYATWADLIAAKAAWNDVLQIVGTPADVITS